MGAVGPIPIIFGLWLGSWINEVLVRLDLISIAGCPSRRGAGGVFAWLRLLLYIYFCGSLQNREHPARTPTGLLCVVMQVPWIGYFFLRLT